jgi:hypothetical protein
MPIDFKLSYQGKFIAKNGDIALTTGDDLQQRTIGLRLRTANDYDKWPGVGLTRFAGLKPTTQIVTEVKRAIRNALSSDGLISNPIVDVAVQNNTMDCAISILGADSISKAVFNFRDGVVGIIEESDEQGVVNSNSRSSRAPNKYLRRNPPN